MSSFLAINGIDVPCSVESGASPGTEDVGQSVRALDGTMLTHRRVTKRKWSFTTTLLSAAQLLAFRDLVLGRGHYWSFDTTLYSSKGLGPTTATGSSWSSGSAYLGAGKVSQSSGATNKLILTALPLLASAPWTVMHARNVNSAGWHHYVTMSDGSVWTDGVLTGATAWLTVTPSAGTVELDSDASHATLIDELVILPYLVPADWPAQMYALNNGGTQWSPLARLNATGTAIDNNVLPVSVSGSPKDGKFMPATLSGASFAENNAQLPFELTEV